LEHVGSLNNSCAGGIFDLRRLSESSHPYQHSGFEMGKWKRVLGNRAISTLKSIVGRNLSVLAQINQHCSSPPHPESDGKYGHIFVVTHYGGTV
jgi:hypothetical protein